MPHGYSHTPPTQRKKTTTKTVEEEINTVGEVTKTTEVSSNTTGEEAKTVGEEAKMTEVSSNMA